MDEPQHIAWKTCWAAAGAVATVALGWGLELVGPWLPVGIGIGIVLAVAVGVLAAARRAVDVADVFTDTSSKNRGQIKTWIGIAVAANALVAVCFLARPEWWAVCLIAVVVFAGAEYGIASGLQFLLEKVKPKRELALARKAEAAAQAEAAANRDETIEIARDAFQLSRHSYLTIMDWSAISNGQRTVGVRYTVRMPPRMAAQRRVKGDGTSSKTGLSQEDVEPIAIGFTERLNQNRQPGESWWHLESDWVNVEKLPGAGMYAVTVMTEDTMAATYEYVDDPTPTSIKEPSVIGFHIDGRAEPTRYDKHWYDTGKSRSGKTGLINVKFAKLTRCQDAVLIVGGVEKLYDLVGPWVEPYLGSHHKLPFRVVRGYEDTVVMMAMMMGLARWRQNQPHHLRAQFKTVIIQLDEASFTLQNTKARVQYGGEWKNLSEMADNLTKGAGSAGVWLHVATQRGTNQNLGVKGGDISANIGTQTVFRTHDSDEIGRATGDWKLPKPKHPGQFWFVADDQDPAKLKAPYIQESDPQRDRLHAGQTVEDVSWARRLLEHDMDEPSKQFLGQWWQQLHHYATDELIAYLREETVEVSSHTSQAEERIAAWEAELDALEAQHGDGGVAAARATATGVVMQEDGLGAADAADGVRRVLSVVHGATDPDSPAPSASRESRQDRIERVVADGARPMSRAEILAGLRAEGDDASEQVVTNNLKAMVDNGRLNRMDGQRNKYVAARATATAS